MHFKNFQKDIQSKSNSSKSCSTQGTSGTVGGDTSASGSANVSPDDMPPLIRDIIDEMVYEDEEYIEHEL